MVAVKEQTYRTNGRIFIRHGSTDENSFVKQVFISRPPVEERFSWLYQMESGFEENVNPTQIAFVYQKINELTNRPPISDGRIKPFVEVDEIMSLLSSLKLSYQIKGAILRYTFRLKSFIPRWNDALYEYKCELEGHGFNAREILLGLI